MHRTLFLLCPTDCLESIINATYQHENYFYTSLGNSFAPDIDTLVCIQKMIQKHDIRKIYFVLSKDNRIISDALDDQLFSDIKGLRNFYTEIAEQKEHSETLWQTDHHQFSMLSYYLNQKIKALQSAFHYTLAHPVHIGGKIYDRQQHSFTDIYSELVCVKKHYLN